jgi:hypothetical protein
MLLTKRLVDANNVKAGEQIRTELEVVCKSHEHRATETRVRKVRKRGDMAARRILHITQEQLLQHRAVLLEQ